MKECFQSGLINCNDVFILGVLIGSIGVFIDQWAQKFLELWLNKQELISQKLLYEAIAKMKEDYEIKYGKKEPSAGGGERGE